MKPITFGCDNGFQEVFYDVDSPADDTKQKAGQVFCYLGRLNDADKKDDSTLSKCLSMKAGQCWKQ